MGGRVADNGKNSQIDSVNTRIGQYLDGEETKNILTPGEYSEWKLDLKAGQVVIAEARSDAFDPALEVVGPDGKALATNDDRFPGDQRPLLLWRCDKDGSYSVRVRCFHDKSGGQFFARIRTFETLDLSNRNVGEAEIDKGPRFLVRLSMRKGQISEISNVRKQSEDDDLALPDFPINPLGLPEPLPGLSYRLAPVITTGVVATVDGDYYMLCHLYAPGKRKVHMERRDIVPEPLDGVKAATSAGVVSQYAPTANGSRVWEVSLKKGDLIDVTAVGHFDGAQSSIAEVPDFAKFDVSNAETNPLYPHPTPESPVEPAFAFLPGRYRDVRNNVIRANRDAKIWIAYQAISSSSTDTFAIRLQTAERPFVEGQTLRGTLRVGDNDYWALDAKAGDVMTIDSSASTFAEQLIVIAPDLSRVIENVAEVDETSQQVQLVVQNPGRYLVQISSLGDGGGGEYTLSRKVYHPFDIGIGKPAQGEVGPGQVQVWRFTATPAQPLLLHWKGMASVTQKIYDEAGNETTLPNQSVDPQNGFGILKVTHPQTFVIVVSGAGRKTSYAIELGPIPGYK